MIPVKPSPTMALRDASLGALAFLAASASSIPYFDENAVATTASYAEMGSLLGLGTMAYQNASAVTITGGTADLSDITVSRTSILGNSYGTSNTTIKGRLQGIQPSAGSITYKFNPLDNDGAILELQDFTGTSSTYGISSLLNAGTNKFFLYSSGTAQSYLQGVLSLGYTRLTSSLFQVYASDGTSAVDVARYSADASGPTIRLWKSRSASIGTNTINVALDNLGTIQFYGVASDGVLYEAARITSQAESTPGTNYVPGRIIFTTRNTNNVFNDIMTIGGGTTGPGSIGIGVGPTPLLKLYTFKQQEATNTTAYSGYFQTNAVSASTTVSQYGSQSVLFLMSGFSTNATTGPTMVGHQADVVYNATLTNNSAAGLLGRVYINSTSYAPTINVSYGVLGICYLNGSASTTITSMLGSTGQLQLDTAATITNGYGVYSRLNMSANTVVVNRLACFDASVNRSAGTSTIPALYGFRCEDLVFNNTTLIAGFFSEVTSGTGKYFLYGSGDAASLINGQVSIANYLTLPKTSGYGIQVDTAVPTFGWRDLLGTVRARDAAGGGPSAIPDYVAYIGNIYQYRFGTLAPNNHNHEMFIEYHIPHDWLPNSDLFIHAHWSCNVAATGNAKWYFDISYADGHGTAGGAADPFSAPVTVSVVQQASTTQYGHMIAEVQISNAGGTGGLLSSNTIQVDGVLLVRIYRDPADVADTIDQDIFLHFVDVHYQTTNIGTKQKAPNFYS